MNVKKNLAVLVTTLFWGFSAHSVLIGRGDVQSGGSGISGTGSPIVVSGNSSTADRGVIGSSCGPQDLAQNTFMSMAQFYSIMDNHEDIHYVVEGNNISLVVPKHITACLELGIQETNVGNNKVVAIENKFNFTPANTGFSEDELASKTLGQKYRACLEREGLIKRDSNGREVFDRQLATERNQVAYNVRLTMRLNPPDRTRSMRLYFAGTPYGDGNAMFGNEMPEGMRTLPANWNCLRAERMSSEGPFIYRSPEDQAAETAIRVCETNQVEEITAELQRLRRSTVGNASELIKMLEAALEAARTKEVNEIFERFTQIERALRPSNDDIREGRRTISNETEAENLVREYATLLGKLNTIALDPGIQEINRLIGELSESGTTPQRREQINARITALNTMIGRFAAKSENELRPVYDTLRELNLQEVALRIEGHRLKSLNFANVHPNRARSRAGERSITITQADTNVKNSLRRFQGETLPRWEDEYLVKRGDSRPIVALQRNSQQRFAQMQRSQQNFQQNEQREMQRHCAPNFIGGVRNPVACQRFMQGQQQRQAQFQQQWSRNLQRIEADSRRVSVLGQHYDQAMREIASQREYSNSLYDPFGLYHDDYGYDNNAMFNMGSPQFFNPMQGNLMHPQQMMSPMQGGMMMQPGFNQPMMPPQMMMGR
jgi:hypothetical protein